MALTVPDETLALAQVTAREDLLIAFGALMEAFGAGQELGLDCGGILGDALRSQMGGEFDKLPPMLRMIL